MILTGKEIRDLARFAGFDVGDECMGKDGLLDVEYEVYPDATLKEDDGTEKSYAHAAFLAEYPDEGSYGLGDSIDV